MHFSRDFTIEAFQQLKGGRQKWPIFGVQYLFLYLSDQNDTYRAFSTWTYVCPQKKFLKLANFMPLYRHIHEISRNLKKICLSSGGSLAKWSCPTSKIFKIFLTSKTYLYTPQVVLRYLNYPQRYKAAGLIFQICHELFRCFLILFLASAIWWI